MSLFKIGRKLKTAAKLFSKPFIKMNTDKNYKRIIKYTRSYKKLNVVENFILYESFNGNAMVDSPFAIFKKLINNPHYNNFKHIWVLNSKDNLYVDYYKKKKNVEFIELHSNKYFKYLASAKYLINNTAFPSYFQKKEGQVYINTWHGTPLKTIGKNIKGVIGTHKNIQRNFLHCDYILNPNKYTAEILVDSHDISGLYDGNIVVEGYPRVDLTINSNENEIKKLLSQTIEINSGKKIILYAPSWRENSNEINDIYKELNRIIDNLSNKIPSDYQLLLKVHTSMYEYIKNDNRLNKICIPIWIDTNELLSIVDILITDYSSIFIDYLVTEKPIIFYMQDRKSFEQKHGLYINPNQLPGPICTNINEVIGAINNVEVNFNYYHDNYQEMKLKFCYCDDGFATDRIIDIIFNTNHTKNVYKIRGKKQNILMYCGGFLNNGITTSAINLLNNIDYTKYNVAVIDKGEHNHVSGPNFKRLNKNVKNFFRVGSKNSTIIESYKHNYIVKKGLRNVKIHKYIPKRLYQREVARLFGNAKFDIVIDFSGYVPFWSLLFAFGGFQNKSIYQHNDMMAEYNKIINKKYKHKTKMNLIFPLYKYFNKVVSVAEHTRDLNLSNLKEFIPNKKAVYVHNCIDPKMVLKQKRDGRLFETSQGSFLLIKNSLSHGSLNISGIAMPKQENINFVTMGRLSPEKGQLKLIRAFFEITQFNDNVRLFIIGEGPLESELKDLSLKLGLEDKVIFTGQLTNPFFLMNKCDCFILSSNHEGQPMVLLEALILNMPVIATEIAGSKSVLKDGYGMLVENSENGLVDGMKSFLMNKLTRKKFNYEDYNKKALSMFYKDVCNESN